MRQQEYFSALEIASTAKTIRSGSVPHTKRNVQELIKREGLDASPLARDRKGRGGGREYHFTLLPEEFVTKLGAWRSSQAQRKELQVQREKKERQLQALCKVEYTARERQIMEARSSIIHEVKQLELREGITSAQAILKIVHATHAEISDEDLVPRKCPLCHAEHEKRMREAIAKDRNGYADRDNDDFDDRIARLARKANDRAGKGRSISKSQVYKWIAVWNGEGFNGLKPKNTKDTTSFPDWWKGFLSFYARPQKPTITEAFENFRYSLGQRGQKEPSYDQVRRCLKKLDREEGTQARHRGREGPLELKARHAFKVRDTSGLLPTSVYTADGKRFDAEIQHPTHGRPYKPEITSILDVATRVCVGWVVGLDEKAVDVIDALRTACLNYGICAIFYVDNGPGFKNQLLDDDLTGLASRLGTHITHSIPYNSQARGIIERFNSSVYTPMAKELDSYIGADMDREAARKFHKKSRRDVKEFGTSSDLMTFAEFLCFMEERIERYNTSVQDGLTLKDQNGRKVLRSPLDAWKEARENGFEPVSVLPQEVDDLFRSVVRRKTSRGMVYWNTNFYFHIDLEKYDGLDILVGYDNHDATRIWCYEIDTLDGEEARGQLICVAIFEGNKERYIPWSMEQDAIEKRRKARLRRLDVHRDEVEAEANPNRFLTQSAQPTVPIDMGRSSQPVTIDAVASEVSDPPPQTPIATATPSMPDRKNSDRPTFSDDESFAAWCCENPEKITEKDLTLLRSLLRDKSARECLRIHGVDLRAVENLIRSVA